MESIGGFEFLFDFTDKEEAPASEAGTSLLDLSSFPRTFIRFRYLGRADTISADLLRSKPMGMPPPFAGL